MTPHPPVTTPSSTATAIPRPASAAIGGRATRPAGIAAAGRPLVAGRVAGKSRGQIGQQFPELTPGPGGQRLPGSLVELFGRQPARLEMLTQVGQDRITVGVRSPHRRGKNLLSHRSNVVDRRLPAPLPDATNYR